MPDTMTTQAPSTGAAPIAEASAPAIGLSDAAARRIRAIQESEGASDMMLRLAVSGGGCSGFQYGFSFDDAINEDDRVFENGGVRLVVDEVSLDLLNGSEVDFVEDLAGAAFAVRNPNATAACGCGNSFSL